MRAIFLAAILCLVCSTAPARDLGQWDENNPIVQWYAKLKRPDNPTATCCGEADAYWADEARVEDGRTIAVITDDRADEPLRRMHEPIGTRYLVPPNKITREDGNPTGHVVIFLGPVYLDRNGSRVRPREVICYVMNGGV